MDQANLTDAMPPKWVENFAADTAQDGDSSGRRPGPDGFTN
jgi:hypothetical protein